MQCTNRNKKINVCGLDNSGPILSNGKISIAEARVRSQMRSCAIIGIHSVAGAGFLQVLRFPLPILILPNSPYILIILSWTLYSPYTESIFK
jgi:hypothetical protein